MSGEVRHRFSGAGRRTALAAGILLFAVNILPGTAGAASPPGLERLFTTPAQRAQLDKMRREGVAGGWDEQSAARSAGPRRVKVDGIIVGSDGRRVMWANGRAFPSRAVLKEAGAQLRLVGRDRVAVKPAGRLRPILVKPGQVLDLETDKVRETYEAARVRHSTEQHDDGGQ